MVVGFDGEGFETALINVASAGGVVMGVLRRMLWVCVNHRQKLLRSWSPSGQSRKCQWLGINTKDRIRMGCSASASASTRKNAA